MSAPVVLITGASRGIGKQLSIDFAAQGYDVVCAARSTSSNPSKLPGSLEETAALVEQAERRCEEQGDNKGKDAACAALEMIDVLRRL